MRAAAGSQQIGGRSAAGWHSGLVSPHDWRAEYAALSDRDRRPGGLPPEELERLSVAAFLLGHDDEATTLRERAYHAHLSGGEISAAVRCAFWLGFHLQNRGDLARSSGWLSTLQRLVTTADEEPPTGLMLLASAAAMMTQRDDPEGALTLFEQAAGIAESSGDLDAFVLAGLGRGQCLELTGQPIDAVTALDEVMVHVLGGAVAEQLVGFAYCSTIVLCMHHFDVRRAQEWTSALTRWCDDQSGLVPYRGACQVYRAEVLQLRAPGRPRCRPLRTRAGSSVIPSRPARLTTVSPNCTACRAGSTRPIASTHWLLSSARRCSPASRGSARHSATPTRRWPVWTALWARIRARPPDRPFRPPGSRSLWRSVISPPQGRSGGPRTARDRTLRTVPDGAGRIRRRRSAVGRRGRSRGHRAAATGLDVMAATAGRPPTRRPGAGC